MAAPADRQQFQCHRQICYPLPAGTASRPRLPDNFDRGFRIRDAAVVAAIFLTVVVPSAGVKAAELNECREMFIKGDYQACIEATHEAITKNRYGESWPMIKAQAEAAIGQFDTSLMTVANGLRRYSWSIRLRWLAREAALRSGRAELAEVLLTEIRTLVKQFSWRYTDAEELVILGQIDEFDGRDAREILDERFEKAKLRSRTSREPWLAIGNLALGKSDDSLAADNFKAALEQFPNDPDFTSGLARAIASTDRQAAAVGIEAALKQNPNHIPSILFTVDGLVDAEQYDAAIELLDRVHEIDFLEPEAFAYRSVIAHLTNDLRGEVIFRDKALARWTANPRVDHLIGRKLSQHYRFREGAAYQRKALALKADFAPAQRQLADDLLRLGEETEGWKVAHAAYDTDSYNVATYNLLELHDELGKFTTLQDDSFTLRMETDESKLYGAEVLALLHRAKQTLGAKYGLELKDRITVEVFPDEDDFAVRTFGMPAVSGYLGVCFGRVITANSPASRRDNPSNWEARAVARILSRDHARTNAKQNSTLVERRNFSLRRTASEPVLGAADGPSISRTHSRRWSDAAERTQQCLHAAGKWLAFAVRVLRIVHGRRFSRSELWHGIASKSARRFETRPARECRARSTMRRAVRAGNAIRSLCEETGRVVRAGCRLGTAES